MQIGQIRVLLRNLWAVGLSGMRGIGSGVNKWVRNEHVQFFITRKVPQKSLLSILDSMFDFSLLLYNVVWCHRFIHSYAHKHIRKFFRRFSIRETNKKWFHINRDFLHKKIILGWRWRACWNREKFRISRRGCRR